MREERAHHREAVRFWGSDLRAMIMEAQPGTHWFGEVQGLFARAGLHGTDRALIGADLRSVCMRRGMTANDLGDLLDIPAPVAYAIGAGWKRLSTRALFGVAAALDVPVGSFIHNDAFEKLQRVHVYESWILHEEARETGDR
jgi:hypothetical protein